jgi:DNA invertase Pin-like site-specific DNA recombinase
MNGLEKLCSMVTNRFGKTRKQKQAGNNKYVVYYRVSTKQQGQSGLGLDAQKTAAEAYVREHGGEIIGEYQEVETGKDCQRPEIMKAIMHANRSWATLVIAKLDRLARNVWLTSTLMESGIDFVACDSPQASRLTIHILAAVAEEEARLISERTKNALAAYKARGGLLGPATFRNREEWKRKQEDARQRATRRNSEVAVTAYDEVRPLVRNLRDQGLSFQRIANTLNEQGFRTRLTGSEWSKTQIKRLVDRL